MKHSIKHIFTPETVEAQCCCGWKHSVPRDWDPIVRRTVVRTAMLQHLRAVLEAEEKSEHGDG